MWVYLVCDPFENICECVVCGSFPIARDGSLTTFLVFVFIVLIFILVVALFVVLV
jgi:hypothetical protein